MNTKKLLKNNYSILLSPIITVIALLITYILGDIYPFGSNNVEYYDMAQGIIPMFYHIWDALHKGDVALWFNWYSGLGVNNSTWSLSAFWLVLLAIPRRFVGKSMSLYVIMMLSLSSFTSALFLKKTQKTSNSITVLLSICYAFCGFSVMYYTNAWQDTVYLFPLLMMAFLAMMKKGKALPFIIMLVLNFMCGYYVFTLCLLYIFFMAYLYIVLVCDKDIRKQRATQLGLSTLLSIGVSAVFLVPKFVQTFTSERFNDELGFNLSGIISQYLEIAKTTAPKHPDKWAMLFCTAMPIAMIIIGIIKNKNDKKKNLFFVLNMALIGTLIICEGANLLMHLGDYNHFPIRMGYVLSFGFIWAAGHYSKSLDLNKIKVEKSAKSVLAILINLVSLIIIFGAIYLVMTKLDARFEFRYSCLYAMPFLIIGYLFLMSKFNKLFDYRLAISALMAEVMVLSALFIPYWNTDENGKEHDKKYIATSQQIVSTLGIDESKTDRIKTVGTTLNTNYGTVIAHSTIADWTHLIPTEVQKSLISLGYSGEYTRIHDSGGTAFTDALLGVKNVLSLQEECDELYTYINSAKGYNYYQCKYTMPYGITASKDILNINPDGKDWIELQNELYTTLTKDKDAITTDANLTLKSSKDEFETYTFKSKKGTIAYFRLDGANGVHIYVNGKELTIPTVAQEDNTKYPGRLNRNLICLGSFDDEEVEIKLEFKNGKFEEQKDFRKNDKEADAEENRNYASQVGLMSLDKLANACALFNQESTAKPKNYTLSATATADNDDTVYLVPLQYNNCWTAKVNGKKADVHSVMSIFSAVELNNGDNNIEMHFASRGLKAGAIITAISLLILAILLMLKKKGVEMPNVLAGLVFVVYSLAFIGGIGAIYALPLLYLLYKLLTDFSSTIRDIFAFIIK